VKRGAGVVAGLVVLALAAVVGVRVLSGQGVPFLAADVCKASVGGRTVTLDPEQARYAGLITAISVERGMPARAATIALATAYQESKLRNLAGGDRDSIGLFQQRPSMGWGTPTQLHDPTYAANAFYDALARVPGYTTLPVTEAAQAVQRSGFPDAYADHEADARVLASALTGNSPGAFSCRLDAAGESHSLALRSSGLTGRADAVRRDVLSAFPDGSASAAAGSDGRSLDVLVGSAAARQRGWAVAQYLVSQAARLHIRTVVFDGRTWSAGSHSGEGWRAAAAADASRVHVSVYA
jgi:hypothetical protein